MAITNSWFLLHISSSLSYQYQKASSSTRLFKSKNIVEFFILLFPPFSVPLFVVIVQLLSRGRLFETPWTAACQAPRSLLKFMSAESVIISNHLILCHPLLLLPSIFPSIRDFTSELTFCIRWPKYWSFIFSISPFNNYSGLIFRVAWFDLLAVQGTLKSLLQHHSSKPSIPHSASFCIFLIYQQILLTKSSKSIPWCTGKTQRNHVEREVGGRIGMGNTCKSMADSCQCMTKTTTVL